jgi:benzoyl-CoA-dihydrodiol lyase
VFATKTEGLRGATAVQWGLIDESVPRGKFDAAVQARVRRAAETSTRPADATGVVLTPLRREESDTEIAYPYVRATLDRDARRVDIEVSAPAGGPPADPHAEGVRYWPLAVTRALDDLILRLRTNELDLGTWVFRTRGDLDTVLAHDAVLTEASDWFAGEVRHYWKRTLKRLDVTSRSLVAVVEPGSCFGGFLAELLWAADRQYMLEGVYEDVDPDAEPAQLAVTDANLGPYPMGNGLTRLQSRFYGDDDALTAVGARTGERLDAAAADELGLVTMVLDDIDFADELRIMLEERASLSPDALTGMEANHRFVGPETVESKVFGRLTAWQNWIFLRPNASGPEGALRRFGTGRRADFETKRV